MCEHHHSSPARNVKAEAARYAKGSLITLGVLVGQIGVILYSPMLTLKADSVHVGSDLTVMVGSLVVTLLILSNFKINNDKLRKRFAYVGITLLIVGAFYVLTEAHDKMINPEYNPSIWIPVVAALGGLGNLWVHKILGGAPEQEHNHTHNVLSAHVLSDIFLSAVVVVAWGLMFAFGWVKADPLLSAAVACYMLFLSGRLFEKIKNDKVSGD